MMIWNGLKTKGQHVKSVAEYILILKGKGAIHVSLDESFVRLIKERKLDIESEICLIIDNCNMCPVCEGVPCSECMKYAFKILSEN